jgi:hypothetical protein
MTFGFFDGMLLLFMIPLIALLDYHIFGKYCRCEKCGFKDVEKWHYLLPVTLEFLFFLAGISIGRSMI